MSYRSILIASLFIAVLFLGTAQSAQAQAPAVQKAFEEVKTKLDDLVSAKDEDLADDLALRIQAFKKVLKFSSEEARSLKVKLLATEWEEADEETLAIWKDLAEQKLINAEKRYEETMVALTTTTTPLDLPGVKALAVSFKEWRDTSFTPLASEIEEFIIVTGQARALKITDSRFSKIAGDVEKLERAKVRGIEKLQTLLSDARASLEEADDAYTRARNLFIAKITPAPISEEEVIDENGTSTVPIAEVSSEEPALEESAPEEPVPTIRDEIRASLEKIKHAYLSFIQMSVEVKKILK